MKCLIPRSVHGSLAKDKPYKPYCFINGVAVFTTDIGEKSFGARLSYRSVLRTGKSSSRSGEVLNALLLLIIPVIDTNSDRHAGIRMTVNNKQQVICPSNAGLNEAI